MLISPLMGPILAGVFGTVVVDNKLRLVKIIDGPFLLILKEPCLPKVYRFLFMIEHLI